MCRALFRKTDDLRAKPTHTREEIDTIIKYAQLTLEDNPLDLRQMSFLIHVLASAAKTCAPRYGSTGSSICWAP